MAETEQSLMRRMADSALLRGATGFAALTGGGALTIEAAAAQDVPAAVVVEDDLAGANITSLDCDGVTVALSTDPGAPDSLGLQIDHEDDTDIDETLELGGANPDSAVIDRFDSDASSFLRIWDTAFSGSILVDYAQCDVDPTTTTTSTTLATTTSTTAAPTTSTTAASTTSTTAAPTTTSSTTSTTLAATTSTSAAPTSTTSTTEVDPATSTTEAQEGPASTVSRPHVTPTTAEVAAQGEELPRTGNEVAAQAAAGLILMVSGAGLLAVEAQRRRKLA